MNDLQLLMKQIILNPKEDFLRLMYADELEARGEVDRAEFIRVQVELARLNRIDPTKEPMSIEELHSIKPLRQRERELRDEYRDWQLIMYSEDLRDIHLLHPKFTRGFISSITCTAEDFLKHADKLIWNEEMREDNRCGRCINYPGYADEKTGKIGECKCGGYVYYPMPDTVQSIERVKLTTPIHRFTTGLSTNRIVCLIDENHGHQTISSTNLWDESIEKQVKDKLKERFGKGIEFELPIGYPGATETYIPDFGPITHSTS